jgi:hypothetical protein
MGNHPRKADGRPLPRWRPMRTWSRPASCVRPQPHSGGRAPARAEARWRSILEAARDVVKKVSGCAEGPGDVGGLSHAGDEPAAGRHADPGAPLGARDAEPGRLPGGSDSKLLPVSRTSGSTPRGGPAAEGCPLFGK